MICRYVEDCRMFSYIRESGVREEYTTRYCKGPERAHCVRYQLAQKGGPVPLDLLPDGTTIGD